MRRRWVVFGAGVLGCALARNVSAQSRTSLAVIPVGGYVLPLSDFTKENDTLNLRPEGGVFLGLTVELSVSKSFSLTASATRTLGLLQTVKADDGGPPTLENDMATTQLYASALFRPLGRLPNGAPRTLFLEAGGGISLYSFSTGWTDPSDPSNRLIDFGDQVPFLVGGGGLSFQVGPRSSLLLFARYQWAVTEYSGLDKFNSTPPVTAVETQRVSHLQLGAGLRVGR